MGTPFVILATGQSNIELEFGYSWSPNSRAKTLNNTIDSETATGNAFVALSNSQVGIAARYASLVAEADPTKDVYIIRIARGGRDITHWTGGTFRTLGLDGNNGIVINNTLTTATQITVYNIDLLGINRIDSQANLRVGEVVRIKQGAIEYKYTITGTPVLDINKVVIPVSYTSGSGALSGTVMVEYQPRFLIVMANTIPAALASIGKSTIDMILWWQCESDRYNTRYETEFNFAHDYIVSQPWCGVGKPLLICGMNSTANIQSLYPGMDPDGWADAMNNRLAGLAASRGGYFYNTAASLTLDKWLDLYHLNAQGYYDAGAGAFATYAPGISSVAGSSLRVSSPTGTMLTPSLLTGFKVRNAEATGWIDKKPLTGFSVRNETNTGWINFSTGITYNITPSSSVVNEGATVSFSVTTTNVPNGTTLYWTNAGTSSASDFTSGTNSGTVTISSNTGTIVRTLIADAITEGSETLVIQLRTGGITGPVVATASTVNIVDSSVAPTFPSTMVLTRNDIEFLYSGVKTSTVPTAYIELTMTIDSSNFFNKATDPTDHIIFGIDNRGDSSVIAPDGTRDHCGPIIRHGAPLFDEARGFILLRNGTLMAEHWYLGKPAGTFGAGLYDMGFAFDPLTTPIFTIRIRAGYRSGSYGGKLEVDFFNGPNTSSPLLSGGGVPWGWDWSGTHKFILGAIASGFLNPNSTSCVESSGTGNAYGATIGISNLSFNVIQ